MVHRLCVSCTRDTGCGLGNLAGAGKTLGKTLKTKGVINSLGGFVPLNPTKAVKSWGGVRSGQ